MSMKQVIAAAGLATFSLPALAWFDYFMRIDEARYLKDDCITSTDQSHSLYGQYARVEGVISFEGMPGPAVYYLSFPVYQARTPLYQQAIDQHTQRVDDEFCEEQSPQ